MTDSFFGRRDHENSRLRPLRGQYGGLPWMDYDERNRERAGQPGGPKQVPRVGTTETYHPSYLPPHHVVRVPLARPLTRRELYVAAMLSEGYNAPEIAAFLGIGYKTVQSHIETGAKKIPGDMPAIAKVIAWFRGGSLYVLTGRAALDLDGRDAQRIDGRVLDMAVREAANISGGSQHSLPMDAGRILPANSLPEEPTP